MPELTRTTYNVYNKLYYKETRKIIIENADRNLHQTGYTYNLPPKKKKMRNLELKNPKHLYGVFGRGEERQHKVIKKTGVMRRKDM